MTTSDMYDVEITEDMVVWFQDNYLQIERHGAEIDVMTFDDDGSGREIKEGRRFKDETPEIQDRRIQARIADSLTALVLLEVNKQAATRKAMKDLPALKAAIKAHDARKNGSDDA